jgi:putative DNA primase/helicase
VFDADPRWLNCPGGELDLGWAEIDADGKWSVAEPVVFHPGMHYPEHFHTRITGASYDPSATCPEFEQAMKDWLDDDEMITYVGKLVAASVRGLTTVKTIPLLLGEGNSGKSTFLEVLLAVLGGYATTAQPSILRKGKGGTLTDDLADLRGFRFATTTETTGAEEMDEARIKRLSGGDRVRARGMYKSSAEWDVMFLLWLATNFCPRLSSEDRALWNRFGPVDFPGLWTETGLAPDGTRCNRADPNLKTVLMAEASGILNWIIRHLEKLYTEGLRCSPRPRRNTAGRSASPRCTSTTRPGRRTSATRSAGSRSGRR